MQKESILISWCFSFKFLKILFYWIPLVYKRNGGFIWLFPLIFHQRLIQRDVAERWDNKISSALKLREVFLESKNKNKEKNVKNYRWSWFTFGIRMTIWQIFRDSYCVFKECFQFFFMLVFISGGRRRRGLASRVAVDSKLILENLHHIISNLNF